MISSKMLFITFVFFLGSLPLFSGATPLVEEFHKRNNLSTLLVGSPQVASLVSSYQRTIAPVPVAVIDSGVTLLHPLLIGSISRNLLEIPNNQLDDDFNNLEDDIYGYDYVNRRTFMTDDNGHGTHVAGIIAGLNPQAQILAIKVLNGAGDGRVADILAAIKYATSRGARVINLSLGAMDLLGETEGAYDEAILYARNHGALVVAAAGNTSNNNDESAFFPSNTWQDNIISVCASDPIGRLASFSNYGQWKVHLCAPGVQIVSLSHNFLMNGWSTASGTSQAAPFVSAGASLLFGLNPSLLPYQVRDLLMESVTPMETLRGSNTSGGVLNIPRSIERLFQKNW